MGNWLKKEFLLGIGIGCIISAFLVSVFGAGTLSDEQIVARAAKLGMVKPNMPWNGTAQEIPPADTTQPPVAETAADSENKQETPVTAPIAPPAPTAPAAPATASITITDGMGSEAVARVLEKKGVVKDQYEFLEVVNSHNAQRRLQTGTFTVPVGGDLDEILNILIGKKR